MSSPRPRRRIRRRGRFCPGFRPPCARPGGRPALFIQTDFGALEAGALYGPGLDGFGLPMQRLIVLRVPRPVDVLWACEEALKSRGVAIVIAELPEAGEAADFTATRRLTLAARAGGGLGLLLRHRARRSRPPPRPAGRSPPRRARPTVSAGSGAPPSIFR